MRACVLCGTPVISVTPGTIRKADITLSQQMFNTALGIKIEVKKEVIQIDDPEMLQPSPYTEPTAPKPVKKQEPPPEPVAMPVNASTAPLAMTGNDLDALGSSNSPSPKKKNVRDFFTKTMEGI